MPSCKKCGHSGGAMEYSTVLDGSICNNYSACEQRQKRTLIVGATPVHGNIDLFAELLKSGSCEPATTTLDSYHQNSSQEKTMLVEGIDVRPTEHKSGTHRVGRLDALSQKDVTRVLGFPPNDDGDMEKVTMQWNFTANGQHCAIWDYKGSQFSYYGPERIFRQLFNNNAVHERPGMGGVDPESSWEEVHTVIADPPVDEDEGPRRAFYVSGIIQFTVYGKNNREAFIEAEKKTQKLMDYYKRLNISLETDTVEEVSK